MFLTHKNKAAARFLAVFLLFWAVSDTLAQELSFARLLLGAGGPTNRIFTAGDVVTPGAQVNSNAFYRIVVRDGSGAVLNPAASCVSPQDDTSSSGA